MSVQEQQAPELPEPVRDSVNIALKLTKATASKAHTYGMLWGMMWWTGTNVLSALALRDSPRWLVFLQIVVFCSFGLAWSLTKKRLGDRYDWCREAFTKVHFKLWEIHPERLDEPPEDRVRSISG